MNETLPNRASRRRRARRNRQVAIGAAAAAVTLTVGLGIPFAHGAWASAAAAPTGAASAAPVRGADTFGATTGSPSSGYPYGAGGAYGYSGRGYSGGYGGGSTGSGGYGYSGGGQDSSGGASGTDTAVTGTPATSAESKGVVLIETEIGDGEAEAAGTGMVLTSSGEILTNNHVIADATRIEVDVVSTGAVYAAQLVGTDTADDVAVLQLQGAGGLTTATFGTSTGVQAGDDVVGVGNAEGEGALVAASGEVTGLDQSITTQAEQLEASESLAGLIETDAAIQPGDSGGPLYDASGAIVGMDTATSSGGVVDSYAIPISQALTIAREIVAGDDTGGTAGTGADGTGSAGTGGGAGGAGTGVGGVGTGAAGTGAAEGYGNGYGYGGYGYDGYGYDGSGYGGETPAYGA